MEFQSDSAIDFLGSDDANAVKKLNDLIDIIIQIFYPCCTRRADGTQPREIAIDTTYTVPAVAVLSSDADYQWPSS